jgi:hypothetical protein
MRIPAAAALVALLGPPTAFAQAAKRPLPKEAPATPRLEFTGPAEGYPPEVRGATDVRVLPFYEFPGALTDALATRARTVALADPRVKSALGERFAYVSVDEIEPQLKRARKPEERWPLRMVFFSHSANAPVEVRLEPGGERVAAVRRGTRWPHEGREEVEQAVKLARGDTRLRSEVEGLLGEALVIEPAKGMAGYGHRVLHVTFRREEEDGPRHIAIVDLTEQKVVEVYSGKGRAK